MFVDTSPPGQCIFCKIVAGDIPAAKVYEDALTVAFMDIGQVNPGHVLVASKRHAVTVLDLTPEEAAAVMQTAQRVAAAAEAAFAPDGITLFQANGAAGGQTALQATA
jgi:histidine triad (HIT) family protein